jgi:hypothetical protein
VHLGFFATEAAAARAYDRAALAKAAQLGGSCAHVQTNFDSQLYRCGRAVSNAVLRSWQGWLSKYAPLVQCSIVCLAEQH